MTDERWEQFVDRAQKNFSNVQVKVEEWEEEYGGQLASGKNDVLEFVLPDSDVRYRVVRENRPVILDKKQFYSHRAGDTARTEYVLSDSELTHKIKVFQEDEMGDWVEIRAEKLGL